LIQFSDLITSRKGSLGEKYGERFLRANGYELYCPSDTDKSHPFDRMAVRRADRKAFISDFKTKPKRVKYPDTGIDMKHRDEYLALSQHHGIDCLLMFLDEDCGRAYGNFLSELERHRLVQHGKDKLLYPRTEWTKHKQTYFEEIRYYPLIGMRDIGTLAPQECAELRRLSSRSSYYADQATQEMKQTNMGW